MSESIRNQVMNGMFWSLLERFGAQGISFVVGIILARLLLPEQYGIIALTSVFLSISNLLIDAGFATALIQKKNADDLDFNTVLWTSTIIGLFLYAVLYIIAPLGAIFFHNLQLSRVLRIVSLSLLWSGYLSVLNSYMLKRMMYRSFFYRTIVANLCSGIVGIAMAYMGYGVWALVGANFTSSITSIIILQCSINWYPKLSYSIDRAKSLLKFGGNIMGASLVGTCFNEMKGLLIGRLYSPTDLALFNKGDSLPKLISNNSFGALNNVLFPTMSQYSDDREMIKHLTRKSIRLSSYYMFCFLTILIVVSPSLVTILYTDKWIGCVPYMQLICLELMIGILSTVNLQALKASGEGSVIIKLELYKKPVFFLMIVVGANISVLALAVTLPLYAIYSSIINMRPNTKILNYSYKEQIKDIVPALFLSMVVFIITYPIQIIIAEPSILLAVQTFVGLISYFGISYIFRMETFCHTQKAILSLFHKLKR